MKVNFSKFVYLFRGQLYTLLFLGFIGLSFLNNSLNFSRNSSEILDAAPVSGTLAELPLIPEVAPVEIEPLATVPRTSTPYLFGASTSRASSLFTIRNVEDVSDPSVDAGTGIKRYNYRGKNRFLYAHSNLAFAPIKTLYSGSTFSATLDGVTKTYRVVARVVFKKSELDSNSGLRAAIYSAAYQGKKYDLALMTCGDGTNDDSNYRLVLFAYAE